MAIVEKTTVSVTVYVSAAAFVMVSCASQGSDMVRPTVADGSS
ncbi:hypothetical protein [Nocardia abscessus]|nr:hypothetical protein [Nocardia abscessus]